MPSREGLRPSPPDRKLCSILVRAASRSGAVAVVLGIAAAAYGISAAVLAMAAGSLVDALARGPTAPFAEPSNATLIDFTPLAFTYVGLASALVKASSGTLVTYAEARLSSDVGNALRLKMAQAALSGRARLRTPRFLARTSTRVREVEAATRFGLLAFVRAMAQLVPLVACLVFLSPKFALVSLVAMTAFGAAASRWRRRHRRNSARASNIAERLAGSVDELVTHAELWRTYGAGALVFEGLSSLGARAGRAEARVESTRAALSGLNEILAAGALVVTLWALPRAGLESVPVVEFAAVFFMAYRPLKELGDAREWTARGNLALHALFSSVRQMAAAHSTEHHGAVAFASPPETLKLVEFGAKRARPRLTASIAPGRLVCIQGRTGAGKTTLFRALLGLEDATGSALYGGRELGGRPAGPHARPFAWVPQDAPLVTASLLENVTLNRVRPDQGIAALQAIGAQDLLETLGRATIGRGGRPVSGGERRLIALARALATGAPVLLLDEPTEGLDPSTSRRVLSALERLRGERTIVVTTHRAEVAAACDEVIVIDRDNPRAAAE